MTTDATRTVVLKPGDVLLIGNVGQLDDETLAGLPDTLGPLAQALGLGTVTVFEHDIHLTAATPVTPLPDAVVLTVFYREAVARHREELAAWLSANGIDPMTVADGWLSIEQDGDQRFIRYPAYRLTHDGRRLRDPRDPDRAWTVERTSPLAIDLDLPEARTATERDEIP